jgi:ABC-type lipoprotein export system ATPase subunit
VAIARALAHQPELLLADEPTGSLDGENAAQVTQLLIDLAHRQRLALIVVTHNPRIAMACDRVLHLRDGLEAVGGESR